MKQAIIDNAVAHGEDRDAVLQFIDKVYQIPATIPPTKIELKAANALAQIQAVKDALAGLNGKSVSTQITTFHQVVRPAQRESPGRAVGTRSRGRRHDLQGATIRIMGGGEHLDELLLVPIYSQTEAAQLIGATTSSFQRWARGYQTQGRAAQGPLVTVDRGGKGYTVPFVGLAEAYIIHAFRRAGVPMHRIRPTVEVLREEIGLEHALASKRLKTDGAEILWQVSSEEDRNADADNRLIVVRNHQAAFGEIVDAHLKRIDYRDGFAGALELQRAGITVAVDPRVNFGQPTLAGYGIRTDDILSRIRAGEAADDVADDYGVPETTVAELMTATI